MNWQNLMNWLSKCWLRNKRTRSVLLNPVARYDPIANVVVSEKMYQWGIVNQPMVYRNFTIKLKMDFDDEN